MNKKFSTLIAGILFTGVFPVVTMAQGIKHDADGLDLKSEIPYRTQLTKPDVFDVTYNDYGVNKIEPNKWYQLEVSTSGGNVLKAVPFTAETRVLVQVRDYNTGELTLKVVDQDALTIGTSALQGEGWEAITEPSLNSSLWKIEVVSKTPGSFMYKFINKETGYELSYNCADAVNLEKANDLPTSFIDESATIIKNDVNAWRWYTNDVNTAGDFSKSKLYTYNHTNEKVLGLVLNDDDEVVLVDIPATEVVGTVGEEMVGNYNVLAFTVRNAGAHVLNAADLNSMLDADGSWANRSESDGIAKFKEVLKGFAGNDFFKMKYVAEDTKISNYLNTDLTSPYGGYSIVLKADADKYFMVATDATYEEDKLPGLHGGLVVLNDKFEGDLTTAPMTALKARYHWKVTYFPTPDSLAFEPLNASYIANADKQAGKKWKDTPLKDAVPAAYYNTVNAAIAHPDAGATLTTSVPFNKAALIPVALTLMNSTAGIDNNAVLTVGQPANAVEAKLYVTIPGTPAQAATHKWYPREHGHFGHPGRPAGFYFPHQGDVPTHYWNGSAFVLATEGTPATPGKYGVPVLTTVPSQMGLKISFDHKYTYLQRSSVANDVYFIQISVDDKNKTDYRKEGMYLVYNMEGRLIYDRPDDYQDYKQMPATQWVIERDSCDHSKTGANYVTIKNREYGDKAPALFYGQLYSVPGTNKYYIINHESYDVKSNSNGKFPDEYPLLSCGDTIYFTPLTKSFKEDATLGYKKFNHESLKYETYAMKYLNAVTLGTPNTDNFLSVDEATSFLSINKNLWNDFEIDTLLVDQEYGVKSTKAGAVQLKRTNYALKVRDNNLIDNQWRYVVVKEDANKNPYYQMAHLKDVDGKNVKLGTFYFKADQISADKTPVNAYALVDATGWSADADKNKKENWVYKVGSRDSMLLQVNPDDTDPYDGRKYFENGYKRADVKDQTAKVSFMSLNTAPMDRVSAFVFTDSPRPLYRTLDLEGNNTISKVYRQRGANAEATEYLFEDGNNAAGLEAGEYIKGFNYLGVTAENVKPVGNGTTTAMYIDSVISSNPRMPKYLFFVAPDSIADGQWCQTGVHGYFPSKEAAEEEDASHHVFYNGYLAGRVMINLNDSIEEYAGHDMLNQARKYGFRNYSRLGFVEAIHMNVTAEEAAEKDNAFGLKAGEYLFVFKTTTIKDVTSKWNVIHPDSLNKAVKAGAVDQITLTANHQNVAFSLRLTDDEQQKVLLESKGLKVAGSYGTFSEASWVQILDGVPVLAQKFNINGDHTEIDGTSTLNQLVNQAQIFRIGETDELPTSNEDINVTDVKVVAGNGSVTILNAAGKTVAISNILGQTVANTTITSDNVTIAAPKGIVVVAIQGEDAVKAIIK
ncbi:DUF6383 domain-containing protein [Massilibacteroides vaginae]|uniref:DUF6383 domain-containing protein n=1 Tax=Massilibacteroides vaginae TaxID=1673718 RepID=UPI000A1CCF81|nr:DUF6383 domain-containing protein [Massilibacteroides vaginae]